MDEFADRTSERPHTLGVLAGHLEIRAVCEYRALLLQIEDIDEIRDGLDQFLIEELGPFSLGLGGLLQGAVFGPAFVISYAAVGPTNDSCGLANLERAAIARVPHVFMVSE